MHCLGLTDTFRWITGFPLTPHLSDLRLQLEDRKKIELWIPTVNCVWGLAVLFGNEIFTVIQCAVVLKADLQIFTSLGVIRFRSSFRTLLHVSYSTTQAKVTSWTVLDKETEIIKRACILFVLCMRSGLRQLSQQVEALEAKSANWNAYWIRFRNRRCPNQDKNISKLRKLPAIAPSETILAKLLATNIFQHNNLQHT